MKGVLFSVIFILIIAGLFSILILQKENISTEREDISLKQELIEMDHSYKSIERSLHILTDVLTKRAVIYSLNQIVENGTFFEEGMSEEYLKELVLNGTFRGEEAGFMANKTLSESVSDLELYYEQAPRSYEISITLNEDDISISLYDAFHILFQVTAEVNISKDYIANLSRKINISEKISITEFEDPLYLINITEGKGSKTIKKSSYMDLLPWDNATFISHVETGEYIDSSSGPSFFDRLEGRTSCSYCSGGDFGLESFIDKNILLGLNLEVNHEASNVDYKYIGGVIGSSRGFSEISTGSPSFRYFRIDDASYSKYFE